MDQATLQEIRAIALFSTLTDSQLGCIEVGEIVEVRPGTTIATEGQRNGFFYVTLEGEVRVTQTYDHQEILMGVNKAGNHLGEIPLLLDTPWHSTARVSKPSKFLRFTEENFWRVLGEGH